MGPRQSREGWGTSAFRPRGVSGVMTIKIDDKHQQNVNQRDAIHAGDWAALSCCQVDSHRRCSLLSSSAAGSHCSRPGLVAEKLRRTGVASPLIRRAAAGASDPRPYR